LWQPPAALIEDVALPLQRRDFALGNRSLSHRQRGQAQDEQEGSAHDRSKPRGQPRERLPAMRWLGHAGRRTARTSRRLWEAVASKLLPRGYGLRRAVVWLPAQLRSARYRPPGGLGASWT